MRASCSRSAGGGLRHTAPAARRARFGRLLPVPVGSSVSTTLTPPAVGFARARRITRQVWLPLSFCTAPSTPKRANYEVEVVVVPPVPPLPDSSGFVATATRCLVVDPPSSRGTERHFKQRFTRPGGCGGLGDAGDATSLPGSTCRPSPRPARRSPPAPSTLARTRPTTRRWAP